jgi:hypothetical protein
MAKQGVATTEYVVNWLADDRETHDVSVPVPVPMFPIGAVLRRPNNKNSGAIFVSVYEYAIKGSWSYGPLANVGISVDESQYHTAVQAGSICNNPSGTPLRPGTILVSDAAELEHAAEVVDWCEPIVGPDTQDNIDARLTEWR